MFFGSWGRTNLKIYKSNKKIAKIHAGKMLKTISVILETVQ